MSHEPPPTLPNPALPSLGHVAQTYGVYLERVRLMLLRYVLALETQDKPSARELADPEAHRDDVAFRCLMGLPMPPDRAAAIATLDAQLAVTYEALFIEHAKGRGEAFEQVRWEFGLSDLECDALWLMLAGKLVPEYLWLCRTLWGDPDRALFDRTFLYHTLDPFATQVDRLVAAFEPTAPLIAQRLVVELRKGDQEEADGLLAPSRRLIRHLMGLQTDLPNVPGLVRVHPPARNDASADHDPSLSRQMLKRLRIGFANARRFVLLGADNTGPLRLARRVMSDQGAPLIEADTEGLLHGGESALVLLMGEAKLRRAGVYIDRIEQLDLPDVPPTLKKRFFELFARLRAPQFFRATYSLSADLRLELTEHLGAVELRLQLPEPDARQALWADALAAHFDDPDTVTRVAFAARAYPFGIDEIHKALALARLQARQRDLRQPVLQPGDVETACNTLSSRKIGQMAQRVRVLARWEDVVLTDKTTHVIQDILRFGRYRETVFDTMGYGGKMGYGRGLTSLFWGPPGTGKTLVSGLIARELGLELYRIELSQVVSKYIGETEQKLAQIFDEATASGMALLFDEADSLFASRTEVKSSVDRYANLEVNFLLQRIEHHEGVIILTTNFPSSIDEAFMRRIRFKAEFPAPGAPERAKLWRTMIPVDAPHAPDISFEALGEVYELTGGEIRNAVLRAAFYAAEEDAPMGLEHLDRSARVEYREAGRLLGPTAAEWLTRKRSKARRIFIHRDQEDAIDPRLFADDDDDALAEATATANPTDAPPDKPAHTPSPYQRAPSPMEVARRRAAARKNRQDDPDA